MIKRICWNITNKCNEKCSFCFRDKYEKSLDVIDNLKVIDVLSENKIEHIAFSGGEALLYNNLYQIIKKCKDKKMETTLISNCKELTNNDIAIYNEILDWFAFPIDSIKKIEGGRSESNLLKVLSAINYVEQNFNLSIKINTVVSNKNYNDLEFIYEQLIKYKCIERWNLFEFTPLRGDAIINNDEFELSLHQKDVVIKFLKGLNNSHLSIKFKGRESIINSYLVISPRANIYKWDNKTNKEIRVGNILTNDWDEIISNLGVNEVLYQIRTQNKNLIIT